MPVKKYLINNSINLLITGDLDADAVVSLRPSFEETAGEATSDVLVDMTSVNFLDSSGIGVLVFLYKRLREKQLELVLLGLQGQPKKMISMLRIDKTIKSYDSLSNYITTSDEPVRLGV